MKKVRAKIKFQKFRKFKNFQRIFIIFRKNHDFENFRKFSKFSKIPKISDQNFWNFVFALTFFIFKIFWWFFLQIEVDFRGGFEFFIRNCSKIHWKELNAFCTSCSWTRSETTNIRISPIHFRERLHLTNTSEVSSSTSVPSQHMGAPTELVAYRALSYHTWR